MARRRHRIIIIIFMTQESNRFPCRAVIRYRHNGNRVANVALHLSGTPHFWIMSRQFSLITVTKQNVGREWFFSAIRRDFSIIRATVSAAVSLEIQIRVGPLVNAPTAEGNRRMLRSGAGDLDTPALHILDRNPCLLLITACIDIKCWSGGYKSVSCYVNANESDVTCVPLEKFNWISWGPSIC